VQIHKFHVAYNPRLQAIGLRTATHVRGPPDHPHPQVGSDDTVSNRQCLGPHTVKQAFLHSLLQCANMDQFSKLVHWHFRSRLVLQTILVALDPRMVRIHNVFGGSADRPHTQENLRILVHGYLRPQSTHLCCA